MTTPPATGAATVPAATGARTAVATDRATATDRGSDRAATVGARPAAPGPAGPVALTATSRACLRPLPADAVTLDPHGWFGAWQRTVSTTTVPHCLDQLEASGTADNVRRVVGESSGDFVGLWFADSDVYKTLEAVAWDQLRGVDRTAAVDAWVDLLERAQREDGYLDSYYQVEKPGTTFAELRDGHELYCLGHLAQAGVAWQRATGDSRLLDVAVRFADLAVERLGDDPLGVCGHPEVETALVELYRSTGRQEYLDLATAMLDRRGRGALAGGHFGPRYYVDHEPVRSATEATGHAVRQVYLATGMVDVYLETGDRELLDAAVRLWDSAHHGKTYVTGGLGARHRDESFGDPYELPAERAYAETCAAIADVHWSWRLLLATGDSRYADAIERALLNAVPAGMAATGDAFFYANPLQVRTGHVEDPGDEDSFVHRVPWYTCACCPPNVARLGASLQHYVATVDDGGLTLHQLAAADVSLPGGVVTVRTRYPWDGGVDVHVPAGLGGTRLRLRVPGWCERWTLTLDGRRVAAAPVLGYVAVSVPDGGGHVRLELDMPARLLAPHPRVDAVRGCVVAVRGPVVHALEQADLPVGTVLEDVRIDPATPLEVGGPVPGLDVPVLRARGVLTGPPDEGAAHPQTGAGVAEGGVPVALTLVPYARWGNRGTGAMRVWVPVATSTKEHA